LEEAGIQSDVGLAGSFPRQVGIGDSVGICTDGILRFVFAEVIDSGIGCAADGDCFEIGETAYVAVTVFTPAGTDFQLVHEIDILFEEVLFVDIPTGRYRGEVAPTVSTGKVGRTVGAHGHAGHVLAGIVVIDTAEERDETTVVPRRAGHCGCPAGYGFHIVQIGKFKRVKFRASVRASQVLAEAPALERVTYQSGELVVAQFEIIRYRVVPTPLQSVPRALSHFVEIFEGH